MKRINSTSYMNGLLDRFLDLVDGQERDRSILT